MNAFWQNIIALALVTVAAGYLGWQGWRFVARRKAAGCGGGSCSGCAAGEKNQSDEGKQLVTIVPLTGSNGGRINGLNSDR